MPKLVAEEYDELIHYTSAAGLAGILSSQCLWATHSAYLNDADEIKLFFDRRLHPLIESAVRLAICELIKIPGNEKIVLGGFDRAVADAADGLSDSIRKVTLAFNQPYILSLCASKDERVRANGLLSQWRGYGKDGGYAIVFDAKALQLRLEEEAKNHLYQHIQWGDVHYYDETSDDLLAAEEIQEAEAILGAGVLKFMKEQVPENFEPIYEALTTLSCLYKDWGFHEEREVRIIAIPSHKTVKDAALLNASRTPPKIPKAFIRDGCPIPYIELFNSAGSAANRLTLPIKRIVIGPHREKQQRKEAVEIILSAKSIQAKVTVSQIPYIGR